MYNLTSTYQPRRASLANLHYSLDTYEHLKRYNRLVPYHNGSPMAGVTFEERISWEVYQRRASSKMMVQRDYEQYRAAHLTVAHWVASFGKPVTPKVTLTVNGEDLARLVKHVKKAVPTQKLQKELGYDKHGIFGLVMLETSPESEALFMTTPVVLKNQAIDMERPFILTRGAVSTGAFNIIIPFDALSEIAPTLVGHAVTLEVWQGYSSVVTLKAYRNGKCVNTTYLKIAEVQS